MGAVLAAARRNQESGRTTAEERGVAGIEWMQIPGRKLVLGSVAVLVTCNIVFLVGRKIVVARRAAAESEGRDDKWSKEMPPELLCSISDYLPLVDCMSFRSVCRSWRSAPFGRSEMVNFSRGTPWLLFYGLDGDDDTCYFYSKSHPGLCTLKLPALRGAVCVYSKYGWILARRGSRFFFCNPFSMEKVELGAEYPHSHAAEQLCAINGSPPSPNCTAFVVSRRGQSILEICSCRVGSKEWHTENINVGELKLDTLVFATSNLKYGYIYIHTQISFVAYSIIDKTWECSEYDKGRIYWFRDNRDVHQNDWLFRFGKRGICISIPSMQYRVPDNYDFGVTPSTHRVIASGGIKEGDAGLKNVKAVWIQPPHVLDARGYILAKLECMFGDGFSPALVMWLSAAAGFGLSALT